MSQNETYTNLHALAQAYKQALEWQYGEPLSPDFIQRQLAVHLKEARKLTPPWNIPDFRTARAITAVMLDDLPNYPLKHGPISYDPLTRLFEITGGNNSILSKREHDVFYPLIAYPEYLFPYPLLFERWGYTSEISTQGFRNARIVVVRLRERIGDQNLARGNNPGRFKYIQSVPRIGIYLKLVPSTDSTFSNNGTH